MTNPDYIPGCPRCSGQGNHFSPCTDEPEADIPVATLIGRCDECRGLHGAHLITCSHSLANSRLVRVQQVSESNAQEEKEEGKPYFDPPPPLHRIATALERIATALEKSHEKRDH